ncbi:MAG: lysozyme inhibitor LprI family protein [Candidatus Acidiferrales bacterium]
MNMLLSLMMVWLIVPATGPLPQQQSPASQTSQANPCASATTQADLNRCSGEEFLKADEHLNAMYQNLLRILQQAVDEAKQRKDETETKHAEAAIRNLRAAQNAWNQYRQLHCAAVKDQFEGGTISPLEWATCMTDTANHRIAELKSGYEIGDRKLE